ncbi:hypothetical protein CBS101457_005500 [Exobasidium rhododendri]|nr:hypothetical protein CBS101457_005500 [Exobasidium rhododendri]
MNSKAASERYQRQVLELSKAAGNETCADCGGRYPRWASWNLGIFLCVSCAGVHRKMGTHISKIKSLTLDTWTKEQVEKVRAGGNVKNNLKFNPNIKRNRPPANIDEGERNSELERFIFDKYKGKFMEKKPPPVPSKDLPTLELPNSNDEFYANRRRVTDSMAGSSNGEEIHRSRTAPIPTSWAEAKRATSPIPQHGFGRPAAPVLPTRSTLAPTSALSNNVLGIPSPSQPVRSSSAQYASPMVGPSNGSVAKIPQASARSNPTSSVFDDLLSLSNGDNNSTTLQPPLQMQPTSYYQHQQHNAGNPWAALGTQQQAILSPMIMTNTTPSAPYFQQEQHLPSQSPFLHPQQLQQQQPRYQQEQFQQQQQQLLYPQNRLQDQSANLGNLAFAPATSPLPAVSPFATNGSNPFFANNGAQAMGQQAFGQPSPFLQQQPQTAPPFGNFATSMMPTVSQNQQFPNAWPQNSNVYNNNNGNNHHQNYNMWG